MRVSRRARWALLLAAVLALHLAGVSWLQDNLVGWGAGDVAMPVRMEVAFVRELAPAAPPTVAPRPAPARRERVGRAPLPKPVAEAASAPQPSIEALAEAPRSDDAPAAAVEPPTVPEPPASAPQVPAAVAEAASAPAAPAFAWPPSTRLTYTLVGNYRGEVHGNARVQWVRVGSRYQVHLDVTIGPSFAPLISRRTTSDGDLGETGLVPRRYDEANKVAFQSPRQATVQFTPGSVTLANGSVREALPGVQDATSQFVQLTWIFTTQPERLRVGETIELPLALPRRMDRWRYEVVGQETLNTPVGALEAFHLKPRRAEARPRGELSAEMWIAPALQYLPVRIRIQQDAETFVDLAMDAPPRQAAPEDVRR
jgi:Protein of unknown function (DUF3108)